MAGFLNNKEEMLVIILTQWGRKLLADGDLRVKYYAFADDEIDYQLLNRTLLSDDTRTSVDNFFRSIGQTPPDYYPATSSIPFNSGPPIIMPPGMWSIPYTSGTFTRLSQSIAQTAAPTTGSPSFIKTYSANQLVSESMGDGAGFLARIEGTRTNYVRVNRNPYNATYWTGGTSQLSSANDASGIDGTLSATRFSGSNATLSNYSQLNLFQSRVAVSMWARSNGATGNALFRFFESDAIWKGLAIDSNLTTTYKRLAPTSSYVPNTAIIYLAPSDGRALIGSGGSYNLDCDFMQAEIGAFPSSMISSSTLFTPRDADVLTFTSGVISASCGANDIYSRPAKFDQVSPQWATNDVKILDTEYWLLNFSGSNNGIRFRTSGSNTVFLDAVSSSVIKVSSSALVWDRNALLGQMIWSPISGTLSFSGSTTTGSAWTWDPTWSVRVGGILNAASESFCRLGNLTSST